ncbi:MAG: DUF4349 domain-containing protein [Deltaproteobacteria bacterium]|nr:DUF4349 domain-containing protein [Deltaproteobacteria bacterium]
MDAVLAYFLVLFAPAPTAAQTVSPLLTAAATEATLTLKVSDRDAAAEALIAKVEGFGGYFSERSDQAVTFKVPADRELEVEAHAKTLGVLIDRQHQKVDLGFAIDQARSVLKSREEMMKRYFDVLKSAGPNQVVTVEREIVGLIQDIERQKGSLKQMEHRVRFAKVVVSFQFRERNAPVRDGTSSFGWLNGVNLSDLIGDFHYEK